MQLFLWLLQHRGYDLPQGIVDEQRHCDNQQVVTCSMGEHLSVTSPHAAVLINFNCFHLLFAIMIFSFISTTMSSYSWPVPPCIAPLSRFLNHSLLTAPSAMRQQHWPISRAPRSQNLIPLSKQLPYSQLMMFEHFKLQPLLVPPRGLRVSMGDPSSTCQPPRLTWPPIRN